MEYYNDGDRAPKRPLWFKVLVTVIAVALVVYLTAPLVVHP